jgi:hypothetical protein
MIHEELGRIEYHGEHVYRTSIHNALASRMIINQLTPLLPKGSGEVNAQVKHLQAMLDAATMVDLALDRVDLASSISPLGEHGRDQDGDLHNVIRNRDTRDRIENRRQERYRVEHG